MSQPFFDTEKEESASSSFEPVPHGWYRFIVDTATVMPTKAGTGSYVKVVLSLIDPVGKNRKIFHNFNIENPSEQAQKIGRSEFKKFLTAIGVTSAIASKDDVQVKVPAKTGYALIGIQPHYRNPGELDNFARDFSATPKDQQPQAPAKNSAAGELSIPF